MKYCETTQREFLEIPTNTLLTFITELKDDLYKRAPHRFVTDTMLMKRYHTQRINVAGKTTQLSNNTNCSLPSKYKHRSRLKV